jgi:hypothetical protein
VVYLETNAYVKQLREQLYDAIDNNASEQEIYRISITLDDVLIREFRRINDLGVTVFLGDQKSAGVLGEP